MGNTVVVKDANNTNVTLDTQGTAITGTALPAGGYSNLGWLSNIWKAITDRFPAALVGGRLSVDVGASVLPSGAATVAKQPALGIAGTASTDVITVQGIASATPQPVSGTVTANLGTIGTVATETTQSAGNTLTGAVTETAPASDTASSGLNGRLQRVAQRITSGIALLGAGLPAAFGSGGGVKVDIVSGAGSGGTAAGDNAAFTAGTTNTTPAAGFYHSTRDNLSDGRSGAVALTQKRAQIMQLETSAGVEISPALDATLTGGTQKAILRGAAKGSTVAADATVIPVDANTAAVSVTLAQPLDSTNDEVRVVTAIPANIVSGFTASDMTTTANTSVIGAQGAGLRTYATTILVTNGHATVGTFVNILDGTTAIWTGYAGPAGGGFCVNLRTPLRTTANTALQAACVSSGAAVRVSAAGFKGA